MDLPGEDLIAAGLDDLERGAESVPSLLVSIGAPRLRQLGIEFDGGFSDPEHRLYRLLSASHGNAAHSQYNALMRRLVSFERALACTLADRSAIERFMKALGGEATAPARAYFMGGATAVLHDWRASTIDIDVKLVPDRDELYRAIPRLKEQLQISVQLAAPDDFIPVKGDWPDRSPLIERAGLVSFHHFDLYAQALAKIERGHDGDVTDVTEMIGRGLIERRRLLEYFEAIEPRIYRYPAIDGASFRAAIEQVVSKFPGAAT